MIRVAVVDDHEVVRRGLAASLAMSSDLQLVGEASNGRAALDLLAAEKIDVLILDLSLPKVSGLEVLHRARELQPTTRVLVLSTYPESQYAVRMLKAGAAGYLSKDRDLSEVLAAVRMIAGGQTLVPQTLTGGGEEKLPHESLSPREYQVFMLILQGRAGTEIAAELNLSASTVSNHLAHVREKLGATTNGDVVAYAHRHGLVS